MNKTIILWFVSLLYVSSNVFSQEIEVKNSSKRKEYPLINLKIKIRNPKPLTKTNFSVKEKDSILPFDFSFENNVSNDQPQHILILVENLNHEDRLSFYKKVLKKSIQNLDAKHKINIAVFDRVRNQGTKSVFLLLDNYTNDKNKIIQAIDKIQPKNDVFSNNKSADLYLSVYEGIDLLSKINGNKTLLILSTAFNNKWSSHTSSESSKAYAIKHKIPVYSLQYRKQGFEHHKLTDLVTETYGKELISNNIDTSVAFLTKTFNSLNKRLGKTYFINYNSIYKKDGKTHKSTLLINKQPYYFKVKTSNIYQWIYIGIGFLSLLLVLYFTNKYLKKANQKNKEKIALLDNEIKQEHQKNKQIQHNLQEQEAELIKLKSKEQAKLYNEKLRIKEAEIISNMKSFGNLPMIQYQVNDMDISYLINKPLIRIGRSPDNNIILTDKKISREHAKIIFKNGYFLIDLDSSTGTKLNGKNITKAELKHGNIIKIGNQELTFIL